MTATVDQSVGEFTATPRQLFINGQWTGAASGKTFETPNPATGTTLASVAEGDAEDINRAVQAARKAFDDGPWSRMTPSERGRIIWRIGDLILEHAEELAPLAADLFHYMAGWATKIEGNSINISVPYMPGAALRRIAERSVCGIAAQAGCASLACFTARATSAGAAMPMRPSSAPVAGSMTAAVPPWELIQPPEYTCPFQVSSLRNVMICPSLFPLTSHSVTTEVTLTEPPRRRHGPAQPSRGPTRPGHGRPRTAARAPSR